ncbi:hypothetical protein [Litoribaculum gwangyangense]|uniref:Uncharacterized protein n=1 Tax=Litoribaculum gwangyangense TaxID=1130722 RepID=A0ABP9BX14_9FLAO
MDVTSKEYEKNYNGRMSSYKNDYIDNTENSFLAIELENYSNYYNALIKIADYFKNKTTKDLRINSTTTVVISDLKEVNESVFNEIFKIEKTKILLNKVSTDIGFEDYMIRGQIPGKIEIDFKKLNNYITSAKRIIDFINEKKSGIQKSDAPEKQIIKKETETNIISENKEGAVDIGDDDYTKSTIEKYLQNIVDYIIPQEHKVLVDALYFYFTKNEFPKLEKKIMFKRVNKKKVGWALKEVYMNLKTDKLSEEYLQFAKDNINLFENVKSNPENYMDSNLYSYFTTNPDK